MSGGYTTASGEFQSDLTEGASPEGFPVEANEVLSLDLIAGEAVYAVCATGGSTTGRVIYTNG